MKQKLFLSIFIFINIVFSQAFAEDSIKYDINKFTTPDIVRRQLNIAGGVLPHVYQNQLLFDPLLDANYQQTTVTRKKINTFDITLFKFITSSQFYTNQNHFTSWGGSVSIFPSLTISPFAGFGIGRIENIDDEIQAIYFAIELSKRKILSHKLNQNELYNLSTFIAKVKNKRALNSKKLLKKEIEAIDSFLIKNHFIDNTDAIFIQKLYTKQYYNYDLGRGSGHQSEFRINPTFNYNLSYLKTIPNGGYDYGIVGSYNYTYKKQLSLKWQQTVLASGSGSFHSTNYFGTSEYLSIVKPFKTIGLNALLSGSYQFDYFPNYQNCFSGGITQDFQSSIFLLDNNYSTSGFTSSTGIDILYSHYFNPHLKLISGYTLLKSFSTLYFNNYLSGALLVSLNYSFF